MLKTLNPIAQNTATIKTGRRKAAIKLTEPALDALKERMKFEDRMHLHCRCVPQNFAKKTDYRCVHGFSSLCRFTEGEMA